MYLNISLGSVLDIKERKRVMNNVPISNALVVPGFAKVLLHLDFPIQIMPGTSFWVELNKFGYTMIY